MALAINGLERLFTFKKGGETITLSDPNPSMTPEQVMNFYAGPYADLTTATDQGPEIQNDQSIYTFKTTLGTKG